MERPLPRRRFLAGIGAIAGGAGATATVLGRRRQPRGSFMPDRHGYGFRNWTAQDQYFETPPDPTSESLEARIATEWRRHARDLLDQDPGEFSSGLVEAIATHLCAAIVQRAGTNGHCYGMVLTAKRYYEDPAVIPVESTIASEIQDPTVPLDDPRAPVYDAILRTQAEQFLRFRSWLGRRAMLHPDWIDTGRLLADVRQVIAATGTAALTVFDRHLYGHQVLAYGYEDDGGTVTVPIYDPNLRSVRYRDSRPALRFDRSGSTLSMAPYDRYTGMLFNRYDQIERATGRAVATPLDHLTVDPRTLRASLYPLAVVRADTAAVDLALVAPDGRVAERLRGTYMDRRRGASPRVRTLHGADPGTYRLVVFGTEATDYQLTVIVADTARTLIDGTRTSTIAPGESHRYELTIPDRGTGSVERDRGRRVAPGVVGGVGVLGGMVAGLAGYRALGRMRRRPDR